jgi:hypothetical protein
MTTKLLQQVTVVLCLASSAIAAPGDPFGGDDTGCVPLYEVPYVCGQRIAKALGSLNRNVIKCHLVQAKHAFRTGHSSPGFDNAEANCSEGPSSTSAQAKFDVVIAKYSDVCDATVIANAQARRDVLLDDTIRRTPIHSTP